jgi:hypothetical protein
VIDIAALARRAVACPKWRWMPGTSYWWAGSQDRVADEERGTLRTDGSLLPDLTDPATLGCLLALVREAHGDPMLFARFRGARVRPDWMVSWDGSDVIATGATEAEALVAALERAP